MKGDKTTTLIVIVALLIAALIAYGQYHALRDCDRKGGAAVRGIGAQVVCLDARTK